MNTNSDFNKKRRSSCFDKQDLDSKRIDNFMTINGNEKKSDRRKSSAICEELQEYVPFKNKDLHKHSHNGRTVPHIHETGSGCERVISAFDINREKRYYFTNNLTPVRVYVSYGGIHKEKEKENEKNIFTVNDTRILVSDNFLHETAHMKFIKETLSFIPNIVSNCRKNV